MTEKYGSIPADLERCVAFHGHLCPGLVYGYRVAREAMMILGSDRSADEEIVALCENDSCAVDALQVIMGTTLGKGNLLLQDYGKNAYTIVDRAGKRAFRFSRSKAYRYEGADQAEFDALEKAYISGSISREGRKRHKLLKVHDLLARDFAAMFSRQELTFFEPSYALLAESIPCARCGEMTMATKLVKAQDGQSLCRPCFPASRHNQESERPDLTTS
ncbi:MAG: FmdE family protein [Smithellaceae bacterium]|nr:FmdE family protein [Smithellaceae bacterium]